MERWPRRSAFAFDLLVPLRCAVCGAGEAALCSECFAALRFLRPPLCARCGAPTAWPVARCAECVGKRLPFATARSAVVYEGTARELITAWKERGLRRLDETAASLIGRAVAPPPGAQAIAFVPADRDRTLWRGHNTAEALARALARRWSLPVEPALERTRRAPRQRGLARPERRANVRGSLAATRVVPRHVVVVDDVYTTGATVSAAATELRRAGARRVDVVTFARAVRR